MNMVRISKATICLRRGLRLLKEHHAERYPLGRFGTLGQA
jgi:hypothetical protein